MFLQEAPALRNIGTILYNAWRHTSISSSVVNTEKLKRMVESSRDLSMPMAFSVAEGCGLCAEQALPAETLRKETNVFTSFLIKYAEIDIKGKNRYLFEDALVRQIKYALKKCEGEFLVHYRADSGDSEDSL